MENHKYKIFLKSPIKTLQLYEVFMNSQFRRFDACDCSNSHFFSRIQPGLFIEGGIARNAALQILCGLDSSSLSCLNPDYDIDILKLKDVPIHIRRQMEPLAHTRRIVAFNCGDYSDRWLNHFIEKDFTVNQVFVGKTSEICPPHLFATDMAVNDYEKKIFRFSPNFKGVTRDENGKIILISNASAVLRAILYGLYFSRQGFNIDIDKNVEKQSLKSVWKFLINSGCLEDYLSRAIMLSLFSQFEDKLTSYGFTIPSKLKLQNI